MSGRPHVAPGAPPRALLALFVSVVVAAMGGALYFQYVLHLDPCPLCVLQRVAIIAAGLCALAGVLLTGALGQLVASVLAAAFALLGGGIALWHSWIVRYPPESMSCGRPFQWFHEEFPLGTWLPRLFAGEGDCLKIEWSLFGLSIPDFSLLAFLLLLALGFLAARSAFRRWR